MDHAEQILALINSKPRSPTKAEIEEVLSRPSRGFADAYEERAWNEFRADPLNPCWLEETYGFRADRYRSAAQPLKPNTAHASPASSEAPKPHYLPARTHIVDPPVVVSLDGSEWAPIQQGGTVKRIAWR